MTSLKCRHRPQSHKLHHCGWKVEIADCKHLSVLHKNGACQSTLYIHGIYVTANHELYWTWAHRHFFCNSSFLQRGSTFRRSNRILIMVLNNKGLVSWKPPTKGIQVNKEFSISQLNWRSPFWLLSSYWISLPREVIIDNKYRLFQICEEVYLLLSGL